VDLGLPGSLSLSALAWLVYASRRATWRSTCRPVRFDADAAKLIAAFSIRQGGLVPAAAAGGHRCGDAGVERFFAGARAKWADSCWHAAGAGSGPRQPAFHHLWDWPQKYASNPVIEFLRPEPHEQRVGAAAFRLPAQFALLGRPLPIEWAQHLFLYHRIQSLDIVQMPRMPEDLLAFEGALGKAGTPGLLRRWN